MRVPSRAVKVAAYCALAILIGAVLIVAIVAWDATLLKPAIQHYVQQRSGRSVEFRELHIGLDAQLAPTVHVVDLRIQNASWADSSRPLIRAGEFAATFDWASLLHGQYIEVTRMTLADADIDLEVQPDGLRNWRVTRPDDRGPGRIRVQLLQAERSSALFVHRGLGLDMQLRVTPLGNASMQSCGDSHGSPLTKTLTVTGTRDTTKFDGSFAVSDAISLYDSGKPFSLCGEFGTRNARLSLDGRANDLLQFAGFDGTVHAHGTQLDEFGGVLRRSLPRLPTLPSVIDAHLRKNGAEWSAAQIEARIGHSDVSGHADYHAAVADAAQPAASVSGQLRATLESRRIDVGQWRSGFGGAGAPEVSSPATHATTSSSAGAAGAAAAAGPLAAASDSSPRTTLDAQVDWQVAQIDGLPLPITALRARADWHDARLVLSPIALVVAGGAATGRLSLAPSASTADLTLTGLHLDRLGVRAMSGRLDGRVALRSSGASVAAMLDTLAGSAEAELHGATLPAAMDAKLGLDGGRWLRAMVGGRDGRIPVLCSRALVRVDHGVVAVQQLALETDNLQLSGTGSVDLPHRRVQVSLTPHRKQTALLALDDSIEVGGALNAPTITLARRDDNAPAQTRGCS